MRRTQIFWFNSLIRNQSIHHLQDSETKPFLFRVGNTISLSLIFLIKSPFYSFSFGTIKIKQKLLNPNCTVLLFSRKKPITLIDCYTNGGFPRFIRNITSVGAVKKTHLDYTLNYGVPITIYQNLLVLRSSFGIKRRIQRHPNSRYRYMSHSPNQYEQFRASTVFSGIAIAIISKCSYIWEKKEESFAEVSLQDLLKLSNSSPETIRPFWRALSLKPEDVVKLLLAFDRRNRSIESRTVELSWRLFNWAGTQNKSFNHLPQSYNIMLSMFIRAKMLTEAESLLRIMDARGVSPDPENYSMIIEEHVGDCKLENAMIIYDRTRHRDFVLSASCCRDLVHLLIRSNKTQLALEVYKDILESRSDVEIHTFELVIAALCRDRMVDEARNLVKQVVDLGFRPSRMVLNNITDGYWEKNGCQELLTFLNEQKYTPDTDICNKIIASQCRNFGTGQASLLMKNLIDMGFVPVQTTFGILITWSCREGKLKTAFAHLSDLFSRHLKPDFYTYNALIGGIFKRGLSRHAKQILHDMIERGITPDISTFRILLAGYCRERKFDEAMQIMSEMMNHGWLEQSCSLDPLSRVFTVLGLDRIGVKVKRDNVAGLPKAEFFDALGNGLYLETDLQEFERIVTRILDEAMDPDFTLIVSKEFSNGNIDNALKLINEMVQRGQQLSLASYSDILKGLCTQCCVKVVVYLLNEKPELCHRLDQETLNVIVQALGKQQLASEARLILDELLRRGLTVDNETYTTLINGFCMERNVAELRDCLEIAQNNGWLPRPDNCKILLGCLCKWGFITKALELMESMVAIDPHSVSKLCVTFLEELCFMGLTHVGCALVEVVLGRGSILPSAAYDHLIRGFLKEKKFSDALKILDTMLNKNLTPSMDAYTELILLLCRLKRVEKALNLKEISLANQLEPAINIYNVLIDGLCKIWNVREATSQLLEMLGKGVCPVNDTFNIMIRGYSWENNLHKARELLCFIFKENLKLSISSYKYLVRSMCIQGKVLNALNLKEVMLRATEYPSIVLHNILIFNLFQTENSSYMAGILDEMLEKHLIIDRDTYDILVCGYFKCKKFTKSVEILSAMIDKNLRPSNRSLRRVISYFCSQGQLGKALELSHVMEFRGWNHGSIVQYLIVKSLLSNGRASEAENFLSRMEEKDLVPNNVTYDTVIKLLCGYGRLNKATDLLNLMLKKGSSPSDISYNLLIHGFCVRKAFDRALDFHAEMLHKNLVPSMRSCEVLVAGLCGNGRTDEARMVLKEMLRWGQTPTRNMYQFVIDRFCSENKLDKASEVLRDMQGIGFVPDFKTHWSLITNLSNVDKDSSNKGFLSQLLSVSGFFARD